MAQTTAAATQVRRKEREDRRQEILETSAAIALSEGLGRVTARRVAERVGVRPGLVTHYFAAVDELLASAFSLLVIADREALNERASEHSTPIAQMKAILAAYTSSDRDRMGLLWLDAWRQAADRQQLREAVIAQMELDNVNLAGVIDAGITSGDFNVSGSRVAAMRILALLDGQVAASAVRVALAGSSLDYPAVEEMVVAGAERELGLAPGTLA
ncbi:TetR/AcrR family transcriptional regulator [Leifsonia shinshuensis]|uniref:TetR family transcriptional regulator n=1 Tax=Leifsonia shinshuensis TaxID=150026 RepID=A0A7G6YA34_9MICO|nr:TetR family transcriptional regulator [Leifsonia shinshuensis]QNE35349.1 TetR family transcriptional regulator [Leifsonia shinshuensis]